MENTCRTFSVLERLMVVQCRNPGIILSLQIFSHSSEPISDRGLTKGGTKSMKTAEKALDDIHWDPT